MKQYKILAETVTGLNSNVFKMGDIVTADRLINVSELETAKIIEEVKEVKEYKPKDAK
jgi:hypothetical protein